MTGCIGIFMLLGIVVLIAVLGLQSKKNSDETAEFFEKHSLVAITNVPSAIFEAIGVEPFYCRQGIVNEIPIFWCRWSIQSMISTGNSRQISSDYYYAAAFSPETVSEEFMQKVFEFKDKSGQNFSQKAKDWFVVNTNNPYRAEKLSDGSFLICWRAKNTGKDYERTFSWLQNNLTPLKKAEISASKTKIERLPLNRFLDEMSAENYNKSRDIVNLTDSIITNYHDTKGNSNMSWQDHADYLGLSLQEVESASKAITEIKFSPDEFIGKGFEIPELLNYEYQLAYKLNFPSRTLIYLDIAKIFLDESEPIKVYVR